MSLSTVKVEELIVGSYDDVLNYFRTKRNVALKSDAAAWDQRVAEQPGSTLVDPEYEYHLRKQATGSREIADDITIQSQLDLILQSVNQLHMGTVFFFEAGPETTGADGVPTANYTLKQVYVRLLLPPVAGVDS